MELTKKKVDNSLTNNASLFRRDVLARLMSTKRDIDVECGYPINDPTIEDYQRMYDREGVGTRVVEVMPDESWGVAPEVYETEDVGETEFERAWTALQKKRNLLLYLQTIDVLSGIGRFGALLLGIDDGLQLNEPVAGIDEKTGEKTDAVAHKLLYLKAFSELSVTVSETEMDVSSPRCGLPTKYSVQFQNPNSIITSSIHWTRVLHVADGCQSSETFGTPRMKSVYNRLLDIRKILGGSGEMFWKGGFPGTVFEVNPDQVGATMDKDSIKEQMELYSNSLQRWLAVSGVTAKQLSPQVADPSGHLEQQLKYLCIALKIPYRIFVGSEAAQLASSQDAKAWNRRVSHRQNTYLTPRVLRPFVDRLIAFGALPEVEEYRVDWPDLAMFTDAEKADVAVKKTDACAKYVAGGVDQLVPPQQFLTQFMGMTADETEATLREAEEYAVDNPPPEPEPAPEPVENTDEDVDWDNVEWITVRGQHVYVQPGQTKDEAIKQQLGSAKGKSKKDDSKTSSSKKFDVTKPYAVTKGMTLYHTGAANFSKFHDVPTWFTPSIDEAKAYNANTKNEHGKAITYETAFAGGKIATQEEVSSIAKEIWPKDDLIYSMFDKRVGEYEPKDVEKFISVLKKAGYVGAQHSDYSAIDNQKDAYTVVLFNPNEHTSTLSKTKKF